MFLKSGNTLADMWNTINMHLCCSNKTQLPYSIIDPWSSTLWINVLNYAKLNLNMYCPTSIVLFLVVGAFSQIVLLPIYGAVRCCYYHWCSNKTQLPHCMMIAVSITLVMLVLNYPTLEWSLYSHGSVQFSYGWSIFPNSPNLPLPGALIATAVPIRHNCHTAW